MVSRVRCAPAALRRFAAAQRPRLVVLLLTSAYLAVTGAGWAAPGAEHPSALHPHLPWPVLAGVFALSQVFVLNVQIRREARSVFLSEIPMVWGLLHSPAHELTAARLLGAAVAFGLLRRQYRQPQKLCFNVALAGAEATAARLLYELAPPQLHGQAGLWLAAVLATAASSGLAATAVGLVITLLERTADVGQLALLGARSLLQALPVASAGVVVAAAWHDNVWSAVPLVVTCTLLLLGYRGYAGLNERHQSLERLYRFSQVVSSAPEVEGVLRSVLEQAKELLHAEQARVTFLHEDLEQGVEVVLTRSGSLTSGPAVYLEGAGWLVDGIVRSGEAVLLARGTRDPAHRDWLERNALRDSLMVPLRGESGPIAVLAVDDRLGDIRGFDADDVRLLQTVANHAATALRNSQLVDRLRHESLHDPLTGLPNRTLLQRELDRELTGDDAAVAVGILDLNDFKDVNDTLGHQQGDLLLQEVSQRLVSSAGESAFIARLGGDEFALLLPGCLDEAAAQRFGEDLLGALQAPVVLDGVAITVRASLGLALAPAHGRTAPGLLKCADLAMYDAKQTSRGVRVFHSALDTTSHARLALVTLLRAAVDSREIEVYIQPKVSLVTGRLCGAEALARWHHAERGWVPPDEFIPLAERSGLIGPLTELMLDQSLAACRSWQPVAPGVGVSVNISARSLIDERLVLRLARLLKRHQLPPELVTLEITESSIMADPANTLVVLEALRAQGVQLSVDDFGTGYSSLSYLRRLPVQEVKIDKSFVQGICDDADNAAIVRSIVGLARSLRLSVVAEGLEDEQSWRLLQELGCDTAQGYLISRPLPRPDLQEWFAAYSPLPLATG